MQRRMRCISLRSVCPRGPLRPLLSSNLPGTPFCTCSRRTTRPLLLWLARWTPAPPRARAQLCSFRDAGQCCASSRPSVDMNRSFAALSKFPSTLSVSPSPALCAVSQDPLRLLFGGGRGVGVLTGNERYVFPPAVVLRLSALRGVLGRGRQMLLKVDIFVPVCTAGFVISVTCKSSPRPSDVGLVLACAFAPPLELICGICARPV